MLKRNTSTASFIYFKLFRLLGECRQILTKCGRWSCHQACCSEHQRIPRPPSDCLHQGLPGSSKSSWWPERWKCKTSFKQAKEWYLLDAEANTDVDDGDAHEAEDAIVVGDFSSTFHFVFFSATCVCLPECFLKEFLLANVDFLFHLLFYRESRYWLIS